MRFSLKKCLLLLAVIAMLQMALLILSWSQRSSPQIRRDSPGMENRGRCDYSRGCHPTKDGMLNVHLIPHSHDDVGWLKTVDQYYTGQEQVGHGDSSYTGRECVRCILDSTIAQLLENPDRRFIFIEMVFFSRWWSEQTQAMQDKVRMLIDQRRLQFVIGGWCMSDSATPYYNDIIDQHALGFDFINRTFGKCAGSNVAWHVDQFGHSREHSALFAQMGFDAIILGRLDSQDISNRKATQTMEMIWKASPKNLGLSANIFAHVSYDGYYAPPKFVMDNWGAGTISDQAKDQADAFINIVKERSKSFKTNHLMLPMGSDFGYRNAPGWFLNMEQLMKLINQRQEGGEKVNLLYSTPSCYISAVHKQDKIWPVKEEDFLPYLIPPDAYWTGYFTSRGGLKWHIKLASAELQACKQLSAFARLPDTFNRTQVLREAVAVLQHHDAITGTEKQHVTDDYNQMLSHAEKECEAVIGEAIKRLMDIQDHKGRIELCPLLNVSQCGISEDSKLFSAVIYNPLPHSLVSWFRVPLTSPKFKLYNYLGQEQNFEPVPVTTRTSSLPERKSAAEFEAVFPASLPPLGYTTFVFKEHPDMPSQEEGLHVLTLGKEPLIFTNKHLSIIFDSGTGLLKNVKNLRSNIDLPITQDFVFYMSKQQHRASGAYIFHPLEPKAASIRVGQPVSLHVFKGDKLQEIHQKFNDFVTQIIRLYDDADYVELEWTVGPISTGSLTNVQLPSMGKEVVSLFNTSLTTEGIFYTDSNGREILQRRRDHRDTWKLEVVEPVSGNYYPITSRIFMRDTKKNIQLTILTDRCQGGGSISDGVLELMVHRRTFLDDGLGVGEPLNERDVNGNGLILRGKHYLFVDTIDNSARLHREMALRLNYAPTVAFVEGVLDTRLQLERSFLSVSLPLNIHLLTLDQARDSDTDTLVFRFEHVFEKEEDPELSKPVQIDIEGLFTPFSVSSLEELSLGANMALNEVTRLKWMSEDGEENPPSLQPHAEHGPLSLPPTFRPPFPISLSPMQIRTFRATIKKPQWSILKFFQ